MADLQKCISANNYHEGCAVTTQPFLAGPSDKIWAIHRGNTNKDWSAWITLLSTRFDEWVWYEQQP